MKPHNLLKLFVVAFLILAATNAHADDKDDLEQCRRDFSDIKDRLDKAADKQAKYLEHSLSLRRMDKDQLATLITQICALDIRRDDDAAMQTAASLKDKVVDQVNREYSSTDAEGLDVLRDFGGLMDDVTNLEHRVQSLVEKGSDVSDDAKSLLADIEAPARKLSDLYEKLRADHDTLSNVKDGTMNGSNNPMIRATMQYGIDKHKELQREKECSSAEDVLSSGRPDCVIFKQDDCQIWEFKPDSYSEEDALEQAGKYLKDLQNKYDQEEVASVCKRDDDHKIQFSLHALLYPKCTPPSN